MEYPTRPKPNRHDSPGHALLVQAPYRFICEIHQDQTTHAHEKSFELNSGTHALILTPFKPIPPTEYSPST